MLFAGGYFANLCIPALQVECCFWVLPLQVAIWIYGLYIWLIFCGGSDADLRQITLTTYYK